MSSQKTFYALTVQQQQRHQHQQHYTAQHIKSVENISVNKEQDTEGEKFKGASENCKLVSAHSKVDQWLLQHFKLQTGEANRVDLQPLAVVTLTETNSKTTISYSPSITKLHIPRPKLPSLEVAANGAAIIIPQLTRPITTARQDLIKPSSSAVLNNINDINVLQFDVPMTTTNLDHQGHSSHEPAQTHAQNTPNLHTFPQADIYNYHYHPQPQQINQPSTLVTPHPFINPFKMDADFWQQARGAPFGLHAALATNNMTPHHSQVVHMQHHRHQQLQQQHHQPHHHLPEQSPTSQVHMSQNTGAIQQEDAAAMTEHQHQHHHQQQPLLHNHQQQQHNHINEEQHLQHDQQNQSNSAHLTHLDTEQSHHLLFNAAAAAAAAAHLSGVVKSNELTDATDKMVNNNNNSSSNNNNSNENNEQLTLAKQEPHATNGINTYVANNSGNNNNNNFQSNTKQVNEHQQITTSQLHKPQQKLQQQHEQNPLKFEQQPSSPGSLPLEALQHQLQQQIQQKQQKHNKHNPENAQQHHHQQNHSHNLHNQQPLPATTSLNVIDNNSTQQQTDQHHHQVSTTGSLTPTSPIRISSLVHHQIPTSSPQPSLTSPSGGSSTPDLKFSSDNNKLPNELQLQLSRSNSAAAISERTLEECWSTLQRLFMHKSAMQQIQQQIPRTGLGPTGTGGIGGESKPHQCQQCMKSFSSNHQLVQHIRVHTGEKPYKCSYCDRRFKQLSHVQQHTRLHTGERPYKCHLPDCGRAFIQLSNLQQHLRNHDAQVERAKNRPFHCNICGKGFATESSLRTHTSKELQLHLGVLQQHAALIGGPNATSCPICHKLFLGTDSLMEHMKNVHKEKSSQSNTNPFSERICGSVGNNLSNAGSTSCLQSSGASSSNDPYSAKRRSANHPCPVCGKHYVNEGSLRKHLACHAETSQLTNSLRMWPCSVCQAVFTYENGLLKHMEHMRMDPKHQFAAQYVLSRAAAERRDRDNILSATLAASSGSSGGGIMPLLSEGTTTGVGGSNSQCPSPSAISECSSNGRLSSSAASDPGSGINLLNSNNNNNNNNNTNNNNNNHINNNCNNSNSNLSLSNKLNDILRTGANNTNHPLCAPPHSHTHVHNPHQNHAHTISGHGYGSMSNVDPDLQNRMSLMAAASAAAAAVAASANNTSVAGLPSPQRFCVDASHPSGNAAVQAAVVNLAAAMRLNQTSGSNSAAAGGTTNENELETNLQHTQNQVKSNGNQNHSNGRTISPVHPGLQADTSAGVMNAMRDSMMRSSMMETSSQESGLHQHQQQLQQHQSSGHTSYGQVSNTNITQTSSHHHTQQQQQQPTQHLQHLHQQPNPTASGTNSLQHLHHQHNHTNNPPPPSHSPDSALHMQQQAEAILRSHTEVAFRLDDKHEQTQQQQAKNSLTEDNSQQKIHLNQNTQDISEVIRLQEHRLEQALRLHNDARNFNFLNTPATQQQQQNHTTTNHNNTTTSNTTTQPPPQQHHHTT